MTENGNYNLHNSHLGSKPKIIGSTILEGGGKAEMRIMYKIKEYLMLYND
jgi:hypothetical protein